MNNNETLIKVKDIDEIITNFTYLNENLKDTLNNLLAELDNKKDILKSLEKIENIQNELNEFKSFLNEFKQTQDDFSFLLASSNKIVENLKKYADSFEKHYTTITDILQKQTNNINNYIVDNYDKMFKNIKKKLYTDVNEIVNRIKELDTMLTKTYEKDYFEDIRKIKTQQKITNFLLIILIAMCSFFVYNVNKKLNFIQNVSYYNYNVLHN